MIISKHKYVLKDTVWDNPVPCQFLKENKNGR